MEFIEAAPRVGPAPSQADLHTVSGAGHYGALHTLLPGAVRYRQAVCSVAHFYNDGEDLVVEIVERSLQVTPPRSIRVC